MERRFIKSGIPGFDKVLGGGFLEGSIVAVSGPTGSGKSAFASQFIYNGANEYDEAGLYISIEESRSDFLFHMSGFKWDFQGLEKEKKFILLDYPLHEVDQILNQYGAVQEIINSTNVKRVVIDSVMPIALFFPTEDERKKGLLKLLENIRKWKVTTLLVSEDLKATEPGQIPNSLYGIESYSDGWVNLSYRYDEYARERVRYVEVLKMKGVAHSQKAYPAVITDNGFEVLSGESAEPLVEKHAVKAPAKQKPAAKPAAKHLSFKLEAAKSKILRKSK
ncbi:MAG: ATPase domain-containing protein [Candidatus ainarchaeum sp.]|nr:ATPase domain-containing protein [Candidatus ainarchaeum sp.]